LTTAEDSGLYPAIEPYQTHQIAVADGHRLYVEESGHPQGVPVLFLHGGPGSNTKPYHRRFFNPEKYRIILFDQRGCGRSEATDELDNNTTADLLADLEVLRKTLHINQWVLFGGSWGATLALLYAERHPERVLGLIVRGTFLARAKDIDWFYHDNGVNRLFPEQWRAFMEPLPSGHWDNPLAFYYDQLTAVEVETVCRAAVAWAGWTGCVVSHAQFETPTEAPLSLRKSARLECHYIYHHCFIEENQIIKQADALQELPGIIVHGQQDLVCPLDNAYDLYQVWPQADFRVLPRNGHLASEPEMMQQLVMATTDMLDMLER